MLNSELQMTINRIKTCSICSMVTTIETRRKIYTEK